MIKNGVDENAQIQLNRVRFSKTNRKDSNELTFLLNRYKKLLLRASPENTFLFQGNQFPTI